ncbi:MAG: ATPase, partial [Oscillospiraceae bacterium]|nr:ATPase [Oscillospiraceae bacterium]
IATNFFECFEYLLGYATNTLSFVRVGGFVLSHAGMMSVVLALSEMAGSGSVIVMVLGNIFVMGLEGLLSGIQVLRLEFYEMFSRYYVGGGKPFTPVHVGMDDTI